MFQLSLCIYIRMWWPNQNRMLFAARAVSPPRQSFSITFSDNLARKCAAFCQMHVGLSEYFAPEMFTYYPTFNRSLREAPFNLSPPLFGHCPNSNYTPPRTQTGTLGHFFQAQFYHFSPFLPFFTLFTIFSLNKCPKPSGQGFRPPPPKRAMPTWRC